jgi:hypothetical protein
MVLRAAVKSPPQPSSPLVMRATLPPPATFRSWVACRTEYTSGVSPRGLVESTIFRMASRSRANLARGVLDGAIEDAFTARLVRQSGGAVLSTVSLCRAGSETFPCRQSRIDRRLARCLTSIGCAREWKKISERRRPWSRGKRRWRVILRGGRSTSRSARRSAYSRTDCTADSRWLKMRRWPRRLRCGGQNACRRRSARCDTGRSAGGRVVDDTGRSHGGPIWTGIFVFGAAMSAASQYDATK